MGYRFVIVFILLIVSCMESKDEPNILDPLNITDDEIINAVYSDYKYPVGFYQEDLDGGYPYYENTLSIYPFGEREHHRFELSTNSRDSAFAWSERSANNGAYYRVLESEKETEKYFEFRRVRAEYPSDILLSRVHKLGYIDRSMHDQFFKDDTIGVFKVLDLSLPLVQELIEYLWFIENHHNSSATVLFGEVSELDMSYVYTLYRTSTAFGDYGICDHIGVYRTDYTVLKETGIILKEDQYLDGLTGHCQ